MKPKIPMEIVPTSLIELVEVLGWFEGLSGQNHNRAGLEFEAIQIWFFSKLNLKRKLITSTSPNIFLRFLCSSAGKKISDCGGLLLVETLMYHNTKKRILSTHICIKNTKRVEKVVNELWIWHLTWLKKMFSDDWCWKIWFFMWIFQTRWIYANSLDESFLMYGF